MISDNMIHMKNAMFVKEIICENMIFVKNKWSVT